MEFGSSADVFVEFARRVLDLRATARFLGRPDIRAPTPLTALAIPATHATSAEPKRAPKILTKGSTPAHHRVFQVRQDPTPRRGESESECAHQTDSKVTAGNLPAQGIRYGQTRAHHSYRKDRKKGHLDGQQDALTPSLP
jgi:hypothetical protein